jgi:hypothetical protein
MKDTFNSNFYITAAAILPVLYLALTLQGSTFEGLMKQWINVSKNLPLPFEGIPRARVVKFSAFVVMVTFATVIIIFGMAAEFLALLALYQQKVSAGVGQFILISMTGLLVVVIAVPFYRFVVTAYGALADRLKVIKEYKKIYEQSASESPDDPQEE